MKKLFFVLAMVASACAWAESEVLSEVVDGVTWYYETSQYWDSAEQKYVTYARITSGADKYTGDLVVPSTLGGYKVKWIGSSAFSGCSSLTSVTIPEGVTSIGSDAFSGCSSLTSVTLPNGVTSIRPRAFSGCSSLASVTMPEGVTSIGGSAFSSCSLLTSVTIPEGVTSIGNYAFSSCSLLTSVTIPEGVTSIGNYAFHDCSSLTSVVIPSSVKSIGNYAFRDCSSLASATILEGVTSIGEYAFCSCSSLERFDVPASVSAMGEHVVFGCDSLTVITVAEGNVNYKCVNNCIVSLSGTTLVAVPFGCEVVDIPDCVTEIPSYMFCGDIALEYVTIPSSVTSIGSYAFEDCYALTAVTIPEGVTSIGSYAFEDCYALTAVTIPEGVTSIDYDAFEYCYALTAVTISSSVASIGSDAFYACSSLKDVTLLGAPPSGVVNSKLLRYASNISYPREYGAAWMAVINDVNKFRGYNRKQPEVTVVSSKIRASDPTILDVVYKVTSSQPTVKVRALAFEDGVRSFANVVRPETFVADTNGVATAGNVGDAIVPNVEHTLSWRVASDWSNRLAKVTFEVLASEGELLPLEVRTIPASEQYGKMDVTWNAITESQWYDALMWLYADKTEGLTLADGVLRDGTTVLASGAELIQRNVSSGLLGGRSSTSTSLAVANYVFNRMGYTLLKGDVLNYVNDETRLGLSPSGYRQYGYRIVGE